MHFHTDSTLDNPMTLTFDLMTLGSMHTERLPLIYLPSLVLIAQIVFLSERGWTNRQTESQTNCSPTHASNTV